MIIVEKHYRQLAAKDALIEALHSNLKLLEREPLFLCIGTDRNILDCFGPLTGTMIKEQAPELRVFGSLEHPLHGKNLKQKLNVIKNDHPSGIEIAIDASVGREEEQGIIKFRHGPLFPGKALGKRLPAVGEFSIIAMVGIKPEVRNWTSLGQGSITPVYHMARLLTAAIVEWNKYRVSSSS
ncbi:MAG: spore protease YyaC [Syntrophomonas sp.]|uniref:spore protease YyaC n=1 Tax=Syntrophomonas sp. TaxID=2053627 RepID=UPI002632080F|nr:spore protease YyaC [Syntrophomonas sp.]MDD2511067.1 spore protease YyaC [Syntrophomonas sp.]MDD3880148.1 spore protease YyaC [Syntrophomonas sp.]MDD4626391.1 spore protease YyaC [Syntrophomonas sp.]